ncbi:MAG: hypothetical protein H7A55_14700 [Verrucomicrobiaceae bacterium]|nr:hypothetical protein [Verrucomicrobiaceae bacterium]
MNALFSVLRIIAGLTSVMAFVFLSFVVLLRDTGSVAKDGLNVLGYVTKLFATGFAESAAPRGDAWHIGPWQVMIGALAIAMLVSVFTPGSRWVLHSVAALAAIVMLGYARMIITGATLEVACLPFLAVWFAYYAMCVLWQRNPAAT